LISMAIHVLVKVKLWKCYLIRNYGDIHLLPQIKQHTYAGTI